MSQKLSGCIAAILMAIGVTLAVLGVAYWLAGRSATITRELPTAERAAKDRVIADVKDAADLVSSSLRGVRSVPVPILTYHYIRDGVDGATDPLGYGLSISPEQFAAQLDALQKAGFTTVTPTEFLAGKIDEHSIILSFDDGYRDFYQSAFPALNRRGMNAVTFVVSDFLAKGEAYMTGDQVREISAGGIEIGAHSQTHPNLTTLEPAELQEELLQSRFALEKLTEQRITAVAYPAGEYNEAVVNMASFVGYRFGVTTDTGVATLEDNHLTLPRLKVGPNDTSEQLVARIQAAKANTETNGSQE